LAAAGRLAERSRRGDPGLSIQRVGAERDIVGLWPHPPPTRNIFAPSATRGESRPGARLDLRGDDPDNAHRSTRSGAAQRAARALLCR
jgi:hypothetical protein